MEKSFTIGVLVPQSALMPAIGKDFLDGLRLGMPSRGIDRQFIIEDIGGGAKKDLVTEKAQKLVLQYDVDIVIAFISNDIAMELRDYFHENRKLLFIVNPGAKKIKFAHSPYVYYHHTGLWQSAYLAGQYAAKHLGKKALTLSSFYESGYAFISAFFDAYEGAGGYVHKMVVARPLPTEQKYQEFDQALKDYNPDVLFTAFSFKEAKEFYTHYQQTDGASKRKLLTIPTMMDQDLSQFIPEEGLDVYSCATWLPSLPDETSKEFLSDFDDRFDKEPNMVSLMGYECMLFLAASIKEGTRKLKELCSNLEGCVVEGPRGRISMDPKSHSTYISNQYLAHYTLRKNEKPEPEFQTIETDDDMHRKQIMSEGESYSGWMNPYLCT